MNNYISIYTIRRRTIDFLFFSAFIFFILSCEEEGRYNPQSDDSVPPGKIQEVSYKPLNGGARIFYKAPADEDLLLVEAIYTNKDNESFSFNASYFDNSVDVYGFPDTLNYEVILYAVDRAGNKSEPVIAKVKPLESALLMISRSVEVKPGFSSFFVDWENGLEQSINLQVDFSFSKQGANNEFTSVFSSNRLKERRFVDDLDLSENEVLKIEVMLSDLYGNSVRLDSTWQFSVLQDGFIPKEKWVLPHTNDSIGGIPQCYGDGFEGRLRYVIDGIIDEEDNLNFLHTRGVGRTGMAEDGNEPWNYIIDLGEYYELSRILTHQRHSLGVYQGVSRGAYYQLWNVNKYNMYYFDDDLNDWVLISQHEIPEPMGLTELEYMKRGKEGDWAYMYPNEPSFTKPTRWFRYEAISGFGYIPLVLSEITLMGRKYNQ